MASRRAEFLAEVLYHLKQADRLATFDQVAQFGGFRPGPDGRSVQIALDSVRRDWPHLDWWRVVPVDPRWSANDEQATKLQEAGFELKPARGRKNSLTLAETESVFVTWTETTDEAAVSEA